VTADEADPLRAAEGARYGNWPIVDGASVTDPFGMAGWPGSVARADDRN
jgi:hypothetical protein